MCGLSILRSVVVLGKGIILGYLRNFKTILGVILRGGDHAHVKSRGKDLWVQWIFLFVVHQVGF
jgi:hypothetical protein